jgi:hypothetical protein
MYQVLTSAVDALSLWAQQQRLAVVQRASLLCSNLSTLSSTVIVAALLKKQVSAASKLPSVNYCSEYPMLGSCATNIEKGINKKKIKATHLFLMISVFNDNGRTTP